jgi:hypothetical protein
MRALFAALAAVLVVGVVAAGEEKPGPLIHPEIEYSGVSRNYAYAISDQVVAILSGFLGEAPAHSFDSTWRTSCVVGRESDKVLLSVRITRRGTGESLLSFETSAPFFRPEIALASFAEAFPRALPTRELREYSYPLPEEGFHYDDSPFTSVRFSFVDYGVGRDIIEDLERTKGLSPSLVGSVRCYNYRRVAAFPMIIVGDLVFVASLFGLPANWNQDGGSYLATMLVGGLATMLVGFALDSPPPSLFEDLNEACLAK